MWQAGGFPVEMPAMSLGEPFMKPTTMLYRNLLAMDTEELLRANPIDGAVLLGGCDKTTPALLMGAISMNLPAIFVPAGPMLRGNWRGNTLGSGSDVWKYWAEKRAGNLDDEAWSEIEDGIARSLRHLHDDGHRRDDDVDGGSARHDACPGCSSIPAADASHARMASLSGRRIVDMVWEDLKPSDILTTAAFENGVTAAMALGGSTNSIIHLIAMAGRAGAKLDLDRFDALSRRTPLLANIRPSGKYLMEDFFYAGGLRGLLARLKDLLNLDAITVNGKTLGENIDGAAGLQRRRDQAARDAAAGGRRRRRAARQPLPRRRGHQAGRGRAAPAQAHGGPAMVFRDYNDMAARIDDPNLPVTKDSVLVLQNAGPLGGPGMPEWGQLPIPKKLLQQGVRDMVRVSDARMSGTSYGACVLHVAPEVARRRAARLRADRRHHHPRRRRRAGSTLQLSDAEFAKRKRAWVKPEPIYPRGYGVMHMRHVTQADKGCDFDFLHGGKPVPEPEIH